MNSAEFDYCPTPLPGKRLLFVSSVWTADDCFPGDTPPPPPTGGPSAGDISLSTEGPANTWSTPVHLGCYPSGPNTPNAEFSPSVVTTVAGTTPFDQDIYVDTRASVEVPWSAPVRLDNSAINIAGSETRASLSADGTRLCFGRKVDAADPGDVFVATRERSAVPQTAHPTPALSAPVLALFAALLAFGAWLARGIGLGRRSRR